MELMTKNFDSSDIIRLGNLIVWCGKVGFPLEGYGQIAKNETSENVYVWNEDVDFTPYMTTEGEMMCCYICPQCGEEFFYDVTEYTTIDEIQEWVDGLKRNDGERCTECEIAEEDEE